MKAFGFISGAALLLSVALGVSGSVSATGDVQNAAQAPVNEAPITADSGVQLSAAKVAIATSPAPIESSHDSTTKTAFVPSDQTPTGHAWIQATMDKYGIYPEAGTQFVIGPMPAGCEGADGCTQFRYYVDTGVAFDYTITIAPGELTDYLLIHEIAHARGIRDECGADNFVRSVLGPVPGHYC